MVIDFQHHYIPVELAKKRGLYSATGKTMLQEGGLPATTMHQRLYDLDLQLDDMAQAGVDLSVLSCLLGWSAPLEECRFINDDLAAIQKISAALRRLGASADPGRHRGGVIEARLVLLTPGYSCLYSISPIRKLPVLFTVRRRVWLNWLPHSPACCRAWTPP